MTFEELKGTPLNEERILAYLRRLQLKNPSELNLDFLTKLQRAHQQNIPYENLDTIARKPTSLDREALYNKIIEGQRGGLCSELNTLYVWLLESLGFNVMSFSARIISQTDPIQIRSHRVPCVTIDGIRYLTDVGYNLEHHRIPLRLMEGIQFDGCCAYRLERHDFWGWVMWQQISDASWRRCLGFTEEPQTDIDFVLPTFYADNHPSSRLNKCTRVSIYDESHCICIRDGKYMIETGGIAEKVMPITTIAQERELLRMVFNLPEYAFVNLPIEEEYLRSQNEQ